MVGSFKCKITGTELKNGQNGKTYLYVNLYQNNEIVRCELASDALYNELNKIQEMTDVKVDIDIRQGFWNGSRYIRYIVTSCETVYNHNEKK